MKHDETSDDETRAPDVLLVPEAAALARVSEKKLRDALAEGELAGRNMGGGSGWRTTRAAVLAWVSGGDARKNGGD